MLSRKNNRSNLVSILEMFMFVDEKTIPRKYPLPTTSIATTSIIRNFVLVYVDGLCHPSVSRKDRTSPLPLYRAVAGHGAQHLFENQSDGVVRVHDMLKGFLVEDHWSDDGGRRHDGSRVVARSSRERRDFFRRPIFSRRHTSVEDGTTEEVLAVRSLSVFLCPMFVGRELFHVESFMERVI